MGMKQLKAFFGDSIQDLTNAADDIKDLMEDFTVATATSSVQQVSMRVSHFFTDFFVYLLSAPCVTFVKSL